MGADIIAGEVRSCTSCPLSQTRTCAVPGSGRPDADIMLIGEAPGRSEDARGQPFVGAAGKKLDAALSSAGLDRRDVYITNVVKCRPPDNRVPKDSEREACRPHLEAEIAAVDPAIICVMGNTAFGSLLGGSGMAGNRGRVFEKGGRPYLVTVHPAATIYNQGLEPVLAGDIAMLAGLAADIRAGREIEVAAAPS